MGTRGFRFHESKVEPSSGHAKTEGCGKGVWYPEELDQNLWGGFRASYAEALRINREMGDHEGEGKTLRNLGILALAEGRYEVALAALLLAQHTLDALQSPYRAGTQEQIDDPAAGGGR